MILKVFKHSAAEFGEWCDPDGLKLVDLEASEAEYCHQVVEELKALGVEDVEEVVLYYGLAPHGDILYRCDPGLTLAEAEEKIEHLEDYLYLAEKQVWDRGTFWVVLS